MTESSDTHFERWTRILTTYVAPTTIFISLLYYFGYIRSAALYEYFGVDHRALDLSTEDYLLRGVDALYVPIGCIMLIILIGIWVRWFMSAAMARGSHTRLLRPAGCLAVAIGAAAFLWGVLGVIRPDLALPLLTPLSIGFGLLLAAFGLSLSPGHDKLKSTGLSYRASAVLLAAIVTLSLFWTANEYAQAYGRGRAQTLSYELGERPSVTLDTKDRLFADAPGVHETALPEGGTYRFRYRGYRLFAKSKTTLFLIPEQWTATKGSILAMPDNNEIRVQLRGY